MNQNEIDYDLKYSRKRVYRWLKRKIMSLDPNATRIRPSHWKIESSYTRERIDREIRAFLEDVKSAGYFTDFKLRVLPSSVDCGTG